MPPGLAFVGALATVAGVYLLYALLKLFRPRLAAIAATTAREGVSQPLFIVLLIVGAMALLAFPFVPYHTFGEDVAVVKDTGRTLIMVQAILLALWTASISIADEIEGRTAITLLSKPVGRREFILGKFIGILGPVVVLFVALGTLYLASVSYKVVYDAKELSLPDPTYAQCRDEMLGTLPALVLAFMEVVVLASISVAISTRLSMLANLTICAAIYALGHLVPSLVESAAGRFEILLFVGQLIATILPVLVNFDVQAAIVSGQSIPLSYLGVAAVYCVAYSAAGLLFALLLFEDRDLA